MHVHVIYLARVIPVFFFLSKIQVKIGINLSEQFLLIRY